MKQRQLQIIIAIVVVAVVGVGVVIALSGQTNVAKVNYAEIPQSRAADGAFVLGNPDAPVTIVEFADFGCPHCQDYYTSTITPFVQQYVQTGMAKLEYRIFPTAGGQLSVFTGQIAECAEELKPGSFWDVYALMFEYAMTGRYTQEIGRRVADQLGIDYSQLLDCTSSADQVTIDVNVGRSAGVQGTPAVMIRYGDGPLNWIQYNGVTYDRGGVSLEVLAGVVTQANAAANAS